MVIYLKIIVAAFILLPLPLAGQGILCPDTCSLDQAERFVIRNDACYNCLTRELNLTPTAGGCNGAVYLDTTALDRGSLDLQSGFRLPLKLNFGTLENGREGLTFLLVKDLDSVVVGQGGGYMGYESVNKSIGFVFDVHQNTEGPFNETEGYDNFRLMANGMLGNLLYGPLPIKATHLSGFEDVEDGQNVNVLITYDADLKLLEMHVNRFHRMTYEIDLEGFFEAPRIYAAALSCNDEASAVNYSIGISDNNVLFNNDSRNFSTCDENDSWLNWVHRSPADNNSWNIRGINLDQVIQERAGLPGFLGTHFPLIDAEASLYITPLETITLFDGTVVDNFEQGSFGVGVGFRAPYAQFQNAADGLLLDWSKGASLGTTPKPEGFFLSRLLGSVAPGPHSDDTHPLATRVEENGYSIMNTAPAPSWTPGTTYEFKVRYTSERLLAEIIDTSTATVLYTYDGVHNGDPGAFVVYNYHQSGVLYEGFTYRLLHRFTMDRDTICPGDPVNIAFDTEATPRLPEIVKGAFWDINDNERIDAFTDGSSISPLRYDFEECGDQVITLFVVDSSGCTHPFTRVLHVREVAKIRLGPDQTLCDGESLTLIPGFNQDTVLWQDGSLNNVWEVEAPGEYIAISLDSLVCPLRDTINVAFFPAIAYDLSVEPDCPGGSEGRIEVVPIPASNPLNVILNSDTNLVHQDLVAGNYALEITDTANCSTGELIVEVPMGISAPSPFTVTDARCAGSATGRIEVSPQEGVTATLFGQASAVFTNLSAAGYTLVFEDSLGCMLEELVTIGEPEPFQIQGLRDTTIYLGQSIIFNPILNFGEVDTVRWFAADSLIQTDSLIILVRPRIPTTYRIQVINSAGCKGEAIVTVEINEEGGLYIPTAFSPNFDGFNDYFFPMGGPISSGVTEIKLVIYNRFGGIVFESPPGALPDDPAFGWDGTIKGRPANPRSYIFCLEISWIDGRIEVLKGDVQLMR